MRLEADLICPACGAKLSRVPPRTSLVCKACREEYPSLAGNIPILIPGAHRYLAAVAIHLARDLAHRGEALSELVGHLRLEPARRRILSRVAVAMRREYGIIEDLFRAVEAELSVSAVLGAIARPPPPVHYATSFDYLHRDWCHLEEAESEIAELEEIVFDALRPVSRGAKGLLVLGAGAGRLAWDLRTLFSRVYATDNSVMMPYQFRRVLAGAFPTYSLATSNSFSTDQMVRKLRASISSPATGHGQHQTGSSGDIFYFVGDALSTPLRAGSLDAVASVYFTDLVPLQKLVQEITRLLRPGGRFVHVGPLDYHFPDVRKHLSAAEVVEEFRSAGFDIVSRKVVPSPHLAFKAPMAVRVYQLLAFTAQLRSS